MAPDQERDRVKTCERVRDVCVVCVVCSEMCKKVWTIHFMYKMFLFAVCASLIFQKINFSFVSDDLSV